MEERVVVYRADPNDSFWTVQLEQDGHVAQTMEVEGQFPAVDEVLRKHFPGAAVFIPQTSYMGPGMTPEDDVRAVNTAGEAVET